MIQIPYKNNQILGVVYLDQLRSEEINDDQYFCLDVDDKIVLVNKEKTEGPNQWIFSNITLDTFHWESKTSFDNGKSWVTNEMYRE